MGEPPPLSMLRGCQVLDAHHSTFDLFARRTFQFAFVTLDLVLQISADDKVTCFNRGLGARAADVSLPGRLEREIELLVLFLTRSHWLKVLQSGASGVLRGRDCRQSAHEQQKQERI